MVVTVVVTDDGDGDVAGQTVSRGVCGDVVVLHLYPHRHQLVLLFHQDSLQRQEMAVLPHLPLCEFTITLLSRPSSL